MSAKSVRDDMELGCLYSRCLLKPGARPMRAWRDEPNDDQDSGWIVTVGDQEETAPGFAEDPANWRRTTLRDLLEQFPILEVLLKIDGEECEWDPFSDQFVERQSAFTCVVSRCMLTAGGWPRRARREMPVDDRDSGWCFLAGEEKEQSEGYGDDPSNWSHLTLCDLVERFPPVVPILREPEGSEFAWDPQTRRFQLSYTI